MMRSSNNAQRTTQDANHRVKLIAAAVLTGLDASFAHEALENDREQQLLAVIEELFIARGCDVNDRGELIAPGSSDLATKRAVSYFNAVQTESEDHEL